MKPVVTWVLLANARMARIVVNKGQGKGLAALDGKYWHADKVPAARDQAGVGHSIGGPGVTGMSQVDKQRQTETEFAKTILSDLTKARLRKEFDRLALVAGPRMLSLLRAQIDEGLAALVIGEIPSDLSRQPLEQIEHRLGEIMAI